MGESGLINLFINFKYNFMVLYFTRTISIFIFIYKGMIPYYDNINNFRIIYIKNLFFNYFFNIKILARSRFLFVFITLRVAEASVGLSLLTLLVRIYGEDIISTNS